MTILKYFIKSLLRMKVFFAIWVGIFALITFFSLGKTDRQAEESFKEANLSVAMSNSLGSEKFEKLKDYFSENVDIAYINNNEFEAKESVFLHGYDIVLLPEKNGGKIAAFINPRNPKSYLALSKAESFLNFFSLTENEAIAKEISAIKQEPIFLKKERKNNINAIWFFYAFRFMAYPLMAVIMGVIGIAYLSFKEEKVNDRIKNSSMNLTKMQGILFLSQILATLIISGLLFAIVLILSGYKSDVNYLAHFVNVFALSLSVLGIVFLLVNINSNKDFIVGASNTFPLIVGFISGVFVEQTFFSQIVINISRFFPVFYYIKANKLAIDGFSSQMLFYVGIELAFALFYFLMGLFISYEKKKNILT